MKRGYFALLVVGCSGCWTEGVSLRVNGEVIARERMTAAACRSDATARGADGYPRYPGYECRHLVAGITRFKERWEWGRVVKGDELPQEVRTYMADTTLAEENYPVDSAAMVNWEDSAAH